MRISLMRGGNAATICDQAMVVVCTIYVLSNDLLLLAQRIENAKLKIENALVCNTPVVSWLHDVDDYSPCPNWMNVLHAPTWRHLIAQGNALAHIITVVLSWYQWINVPLCDISATPIANSV
jgi:hypothetical protein